MTVMFQSDNSIDFDKPCTRDVFDLIPNRKQLIWNYEALDKRLHSKSSNFKRFALKRLKLINDLCSKEVRNDKVPLDIVNRLANFCLEIIPLIESEKIVMPTAFEFNLIVKWYIKRQVEIIHEPVQILTTVCPDYPYEKVRNKAVYTPGILGDDIGLVGASIINNAPCFLNVLSETLKINIHWIVAYAGFEANDSNLKAMNISFEEFTSKLETSAMKLQNKLNVEVGILPEAVGIKFEQFNEMRNSYKKNDFQIQRNGMEALSQAVDARDWACIYTIANDLNAIILDGASVYMGRKAYKQTGEILNNYTPMFFCVSNYKGFY